MQALKLHPNPRRGTSRFRHPLLLVKYRLLGIVLLASLVACGGGNSATDLAETSAPMANTTDNANGSTGTAGNANGNTPDIPVVPLIMTPGAYMATVNNKDWVSFVMRSQQGSGVTSQYLSLYYNSTDPDILSGSGLIAGANSAVLTKAALFQNLFATVRLGSGALSKPSENTLKADFNFPASGSELAKSISVVLNLPSNYQYNLAPSQTSVQGTWQGRLSYGMGSSSSYTMVVSGQGAVTSSLSFQQDCRITQSTLLPNFDGTNLFAWNLTIPNATQCSFKNQVLTGAAFVTASPVAGKTQRLYAVAISPDGRGVSFKADR